MMSDWNSFMSVKHLFLSLIVRWARLFAALIINIAVTAYVRVEEKEREKVKKY